MNSPGPSRRNSLTASIKKMCKLMMPMLGNGTMIGLTDISTRFGEPILSQLSQQDQLIMSKTLISSPQHGITIIGDNQHTPMITPSLAPDSKADLLTMELSAESDLTQSGLLIPIVESGNLTSPPAQSSSPLQEAITQASATISSGVDPDTTITPISTRSEMPCASDDLH